MRKMHDQITDKGRQVYHRLKTAIFCGAPDIEEQTAEQLPGTAYADPALRLFPCNTKEAVTRSAVYLFGQKAFGTQWESAIPFEKVAERLERAARFFGISDAVQAIREKAAEAAVPDTNSVDLPPDAYAVDEVFDGRRILRFPAVNAATTKLAAEALVEHRARYPYAWRRKAAERVLMRAKSFGADIGGPQLECLSRMAGISPAPQADAARELYIQAGCFRGKAAAAVRDAAAAVAAGAADTPETRSELCELVDKVASTLMPDSRPLIEDALFCVPMEKAAGAPESVTLTTGNTYDIGSLMQAPADTFRVLGDDVAAELVDNGGALDAKRMTDILPTLPRPEASLLDTALASVSISPRNKEASGERKGHDMLDDLEGWEAFLRKRGSRVSSKSFTITAPLRFNEDVHDELPLTVTG
jgi:hypothetical protein